MWLDCRKLNLTQEELMRLFLEKGKLALNDGITFGNDGIGFVRMNVAVPHEVLVDGCNRLEKAIEAWRNDNK